MREEDKKVYIVLPNSVNERLIYDFNLEVGDYMYSSYTELSYEVLEIDMVEIDGKLRKRFNLENYETWIEGIGTLNNFLPDALNGQILTYTFPEALNKRIMEDPFAINYIKKGDKIIYSTDAWYFKEDECNTSGLNKTNSPQNIISPNPVKDNLSIQNSSGQVFELTDLNGKILMRKKINSDDQLLNLSHISAGLYIYRMLQDTQIISSGKIMKVAP